MRIDLIIEVINQCLFFLGRFSVKISQFIESIYIKHSYKKSICKIDRSSSN